MTSTGTLGSGRKEWALKLDKLLSLIGHIGNQARHLSTSVLWHSWSSSLLNVGLFIHSSSSICSNISLCLISKSEERKVKQSNDLFRLSLSHSWNYDCIIHIRSFTLMWHLSVQNGTYLCSNIIPMLVNVSKKKPPTVQIWATLKLWKKDETIIFHLSNMFILGTKSN